MQQLVVFRGLNMFNKPQIADNTFFNIFLIIVGIIAFLVFSFIFDAGYLLSFIIAFLPVLVGIINLKEIRKDKS
ncbi:hypothetical protein [Staphylococcus hyicus]|uniref:hypothetical protein n=1 Tax=Staphylococcus hyicus TaxID=1284 RepID=UPI003132DB12